MTKIYCDRCGKDVSNYNVMDAKPCMLIEASTNQTFHLCGDCSVRAREKVSNKDLIEKFLNDLNNKGKNNG